MFVCSKNALWEHHIHNTFTWKTNQAESKCNKVSEFDVRRCKWCWRFCYCWLFSSVSISFYFYLFEFQLHCISTALHIANSTGKLDQIHEFYRVKMENLLKIRSLIFFMCDQLEHTRYRFTRYTRRSATIFGHDLCHFFAVRSFLYFIYLFVESDK